MTDEEAKALSDCGHGCYVIGGPWIAEDPNCPVHGLEASDARRTAEYWKDEHHAANAEIDRLRAQVAEGRELLVEARSHLIYGGWPIDRVDAYLAATATQEKE